LANTSYQKTEITKPIGSYATPGSSSIRIENRTDYPLTLYMAGPEYQILNLEKDTKQDIEIASGFYRIIAEFDGPETNPIYSENNYEEGKLYRQIYEITEEEEND